MTIKELIKIGDQKLKGANVQEASLKTKLLLAFVLNTNKEYLIINDDQEINDDKIKTFNNGTEQLCKKVPLEHITHSKEFMNLKFYVDENVLIPRPDTEILVEEILKRCKTNDNILDLCTGSGAIAISLAKYAKEVNVTGIDISVSAIEIAKKNAITNQTNVNFYESNLFENVKNTEWNIIVSNPPYIETNVIEKLEPEVKCEPIIALNGGEDGLDFYREIIAKSSYYLKEGGTLGLEIGYNQADSVISLIKQNSNFYNEKIIKDLSGNDRVIICNKRSK